MSGASERLTFLKGLSLRRFVCTRPLFPSNVAGSLQMWRGGEGLWGQSECGCKCPAAAAGVGNSLYMSVQYHVVGPLFFCLQHRYIRIKADKRYILGKCEASAGSPAQSIGVCSCFRRCQHRVDSIPFHCAGCRSLHNSLAHWECLTGNNQIITVFIDSFLLARLSQRFCMDLWLWELNVVPIFRFDLAV